MTVDADDLQHAAPGGPTASAAPLDGASAEALDSLTRLAARLLRAPFSFITLLDSGRESIAAAFGLPASSPREAAAPPSRALCERVAASRGPLVATDARALDDCALLRGTGAASLIAVPLGRDGGGPAGCLAAADGTARAWGSGEGEILDLLGRCAGEVLRARLDAAGSKEALERAEEHLDSFLGVVAHDLRAPLRAMQGFARILLEDHGDRLEEDARECAEHVASAAARMDGMILALAAYSRLRRAEIHLGRVALGAAVEAAAAAAAAGGDAPDRVEVDRPLPDVVAHRPTLLLVLEGLLSNALKFVHRGERPSVRVRAETRGPRVRLWVEDRGIGIPTEHHDRIFRPFERLHGPEAYPGHGMGLALVREGAARMGGAAGVEPRPEGGSRFWVDLKGI